MAPDLVRKLSEADVMADQIAVSGRVRRQNQQRRKISHGRRSGCL